MPIDPCQGVIMGISVAMGEGIQRAYIDRDVRTYEPDPITVPIPICSRPYRWRRTQLPRCRQRRGPRREASGKRELPGWRSVCMSSNLIMRRSWHYARFRTGHM